MAGGSALPRKPGRAESAAESTSTSRSARIRNRISLIFSGAGTPDFTFEQDLEASRVYKRSLNRHSQSSIASTSVETTALSFWSGLSLSQISDLSFYALPIYAVDLSNSESYIFGNAGAKAVQGLDEGSEDAGQGTKLPIRPGLQVADLLPAQGSGRAGRVPLGSYSPSEKASRLLGLTL